MSPLTPPGGRGAAATTIPAQPPLGAFRAGGGGALGAALPTRQRHNGLTALAVALIVGLAAVGAYLYSSAGSKVPVVMVVRHVQAGQVLQRQDLTTVAVSGGVTAFGAGRLPGLVGERAAVTLLPNMLLQQSMVTTGRTLQAGHAQVGVAVTAGQIPADGLAPGDVVRVVQVPDKGAGGGAGATAAGAARPAVLAPRATVFASVPDPATNGSTLLTLVVPDAASNAIAAVSAAGLVALVKIPGSGS